VEKITVYFAPGTCARVSMTALEQAGAAFDSRVVSFKAGEHRDSDFLLLNPAGKVPALIFGADTIVENVAIATYLADQFPDAGLLPKANTPAEKAAILSDLSFCASVLHPFVTRVRIPHYFCDLEDAPARVYDLAVDGLGLHFDRINTRLANQTWWYGDQWSMLDSYINWVWFRVKGADMDMARWPHFNAHAARVAVLPAHQRVLAREAIGQADLERRGLAFSFTSGSAPGDASLAK
jgi:glutathione S-transferase